MQIVYVLTNPAMPGLVKIGYTSQEDANTRLAQLYSTGVPVPFELKYACRTDNAEEVERALHIAFSPSRINPKREFFKIEPEQAIAILKLLHKTDVTAEIESQPNEVDQESLNATKQLRSKRPPMNFLEMRIPIGSQLVCTQGGEIATVASAKKVNFKGDEMSLTAATREVFGIDYSVQPSPYWSFNGKLLRDYYEETYTDVE